MGVVILIMSRVGRMVVLAYRPLNRYGLDICYHEHGRSTFQQEELRIFLREN